MATAYRCSSCNAAVPVDEDGRVAPPCSCNATIIAEASVTLQGRGGVA